MKDYPSIPASTGQRFTEFDAHVFDKLDGSNLRFEVTPQKGLVKQGTRTRLFDGTDLVFGGAIDVFNKTLAEPIRKLAKDQGWQRVIVFAEFWGQGSFAGTHVPTDPKRLTVFDLNPYKKGILGPREFLKVTKDLPDCASYLGLFRWTRGFVQQVREGQLPGVTLEGVVGKAGEGHDLQMAKAKTQAWIDLVKQKLTPEEAERLLNS